MHKNHFLSALRRSPMQSFSEASATLANSSFPVGYLFTNMYQPPTGLNGTCTGPTYSNGGLIGNCRVPSCSSTGCEIPCPLTLPNCQSAVTYAELDETVPTTFYVHSVYFSSNNCSLGTEIPTSHEIVEISSFDCNDGQSVSYVPIAANGSLNSLDLSSFNFPPSGGISIWWACTLPQVSVS